MTVIYDPDMRFFLEHRDRRSRIRLPIGKESEKEFRTLGPHDFKRRRIIVWKSEHAMPNGQTPILRMPFLAFSDETISDDDETLLPIIDREMRRAAEEYGIPTDPPKAN